MVITRPQNTPLLWCSLSSRTGRGASDTIIAITRQPSNRSRTKLDLASSYCQLRVLPTHRWKTSFWSQVGQSEWNFVPFSLQGASSMLMQDIACDESGAHSGAGLYRRPKHGPFPPNATTGPMSLYEGLLGASGQLGRCALVYMDACLLHLPSLEQHLLDVADLPSSAAVC